MLTSISKLHRNLSQTIFVNENEKQFLASNIRTLFIGMDLFLCVLFDSNHYGQKNILLVSISEQIIDKTVQNSEL